MSRRLTGARVGAWPFRLAKCLSLAVLLSGGLTGVSLVSSDAEAKTPGSTYCYYGTCHRVKTIAETEKLVGGREILQASFYDSCKTDSYNPCGLTSSGEVFSPGQANNAASPIYPDGTTLLVWSPDSKEAAVLRVNNAGPYWGKRTLDVSRAAADALGFRPRGIGTLQVRVLDAPSRSEATYSRNRKYAPVPGPMGQYASLDEAHLGLKMMDALDRMPTTLLTGIADASQSLRPAIDATALQLDASSQPIIIASSDGIPRSLRTTASQRPAAKATPRAAKKKHYAARRAGKRSTVAARRAHKARYAHVVSRKAAARKRIARRHLRSGRSISAMRRVYKRPALSRQMKRSGRVAALQTSHKGAHGYSHGLSGGGGWFEVPARAVGETQAPRIRVPVHGPVQVV